MIYRTPVITYPYLRLWDNHTHHYLLISIGRIQLPITAPCVLFYRNFTTLLRRLYDRGEHSWYPLCSYSREAKNLLAR
jgi:hypothetical protein